MKRILKLFAVLLSFIMVLSLGGCTLNTGTTWAAKSGDVTAPAGLYIINVLNTYNSAVSALQQQYTQDAASVNTKDIWKNKLDGVAINDWITNESKKNVTNYFTILKEFNERGFAFDEADLALIDQEVAEYLKDDGAATYADNGVSKESIRLQVESRYRSRILFNSIYAKGGAKEVSDADLKAYYAENYVNVQYLAVSIADLEADVLSARKKLVEDNMALARDGKDFFEVLKQTEYALLKEDSTVTDADLPTRADDYYDHLITASTEAYYPEEMITALTGMKGGDIKVVTTDSTLIMLKRIDPMTDTATFEESREAILSAMKNQEFLDQVATWSEGLDITFNSSALRRYTAKKMLK